MNELIKILGINYGGHDTSACLMVDGQFVACCEEERYNKIKHLYGRLKHIFYNCIALFFNNTLDKFTVKFH